ncbi:hypothetical protein PI124_g18921 [Phytophthora idaei]|nr:hypothetical protein PI125_g21294 [Phytophthora idaei]KAG3135405.1 hypothetical protein PI126_g18277 [Phytophthora idaei]KAG3236070.1 hypothetical protein PI124_g18921 [Phytophthora idaei]
MDCRLTQYTIRTTDFSTELVVKFWEYDRKTKPDSKLPVLALTILSIAVNTATCERLFSELSLIHTPKRNRLGTDKAIKLQILRQHVREKNRSEKVLPSSSNKLLWTIDARERPRIATPQNSGRAPPQTTNIVASTPARQLQNGRETPDHQLQGGCTTPSAVRNLFAEQPGVGTQSLGRGPRKNEFDTPERRPSHVYNAVSREQNRPNSSQCNTSAAHTIFCANAGNGYLVAVGEGGVVARNLVAEFDGLLSTTELDEYLEEFVWEEFGGDGDEETDGVWDRILGATRSSSANGNGEGTGADSNSAEGEVQTAAVAVIRL